MKDKNSHSYLVPPADMVLDLIRSAPEAEDSFCPFIYSQQLHRRR